MLLADIGIVTNAMTVLNAPPSLIQQIRDLLLENSDGLESQGQGVTDVAPSWFGGSTNANRIGVNTRMAHQEVVEEFQKLANSLREYSEALQLWATEVAGVDADTNAEMTMRQQAIEQVNTTVTAAQDESSSDTIGDGHYTEPPAPAAPATDGSTS
ncbi:hypothetical protein [Nocardioides baculatus]|uniref:WXG100 family type VII secretion target n=1 Tax=Nocardioides baculatus TaxID=2801337 RepID=A0ABS1LAV7_9ACTN|nr:hypothetical protein [Nocardioides baculatus]MBL0748818.1 hypothetical protein [Nocardioides baculatus]